MQTAAQYPEDHFLDLDLVLDPGPSQQTEMAFPSLDINSPYREVVTPLADIFHSIERKLMRMN